jgi:glyoxylase-like metal-dependent hydrolase (beta-lactamase superfamily II)
MTKSLFDISNHFTVAYLAEGVYAAIHTEGGAAICNAGLIDLGDLLVVFDTFLTPQAARDLKQFSINTLGKAPDIVINSHYHNDHIWGNQEFKDAKLISSIRTCELIETEGKMELEWCQAHAAEELERLQERWQNAGDETEKEKLQGMLGYYEGLVEALPNLSVCKPSLTFERKLSLHGEKRSLELIAFESGHTASDTVLFLPPEGILFMGDLLFIKSHPYLSEGDPKKLLETLDMLLKLDVECFVPGHGPVGKREDVHAMIEFVRFCIDTVEDCIKTGCGLETLLETAIPEKFTGWQMPQMFKGNLKSIYEKMMENEVK